MARDECRYYRSFGDYGRCVKDNEKDPKCEYCDVDPKYDKLFNHHTYHRYIANSSPKRCEEVYHWVQQLIKEGIVNAEETDKE